MAVEAVASHVSIALVCRALQIRVCCYRYERKLNDENAEIAELHVKPTVIVAPGALACAFCICGM